MESRSYITIAGALIVSPWQNCKETFVSTEQRSVIGAVLAFLADFREPPAQFV